MKRRLFIPAIGLSRLLAISTMAVALIFGCAKDDDEEKRLEQAQKIMEEYQDKLDERMIEEAEKRGMGKEVREMIEAKKEREREKREKEEKEIRKILGEPGKPIEDKYLEELFAPEFPYESISIVEKADGSRYIIIDAEKKITLKQRTQYVSETLLSRGVSVHREISEYTNDVSDFILTIVRKTETPGVIEYSEDRLYTLHKPEGYNYYIKEGLREALKFKNDKVMIEISPDFGHKFKRKVIYPEKDCKGPEPQDLEDMPENITRYPNSKRRGFYKDTDGYIRIYYVTTDPIEKVIEFYVKKKREYYDNHPYLRKRPFYWEGSEEYYILSHLQPYNIFGIEDIGRGVSNFSISDDKKNVYIYISQSGNAYMKNYVEIFISGGGLITHADDYIRDLVDDSSISINPQAPLHKKSKDFIFSLRKSKVAEYRSLNIFSDDYQPDSSIFGQINENANWIEDVQFFVSNPYLLVLTSAADRVNALMPFCSMRSVNYSDGKITATYRGQSARQWFHYIYDYYKDQYSGIVRLWFVNAQDAGFKYASIDPGRSANVDFNKSAPNSVVGGIYKTHEFFHVGRYAKNNLSPADGNARIKLIERDVRTVIYIKLWKDKPASKNIPEDFAYEIVFDP